MKLKNWVVKTLSIILGGWVFFIGLTIDNVLENKIYDIILIVWTCLALISFKLLYNYSNVFKD